MPRFLLLRKIPIFLLVLEYLGGDTYSARPTQAFSLPNFRSGDQRYFRTFPKKIEDWNHDHVENWLELLGFGRYASKFASDYGDTGIDGDRLVYLGTEDQLDHIEYQLSLVGVDDESDQTVLGDAIIQLVAASEVSPDLIESLANKIPVENRDAIDNDYQI